MGFRAATKGSNHNTAQCHSILLGQTAQRVVSPCSIMFMPRHAMMIIPRDATAHKIAGNGLYHQGVQGIQTPLSLTLPYDFDIPGSPLSPEYIPLYVPPTQLQSLNSKPYTINLSLRIQSSVSTLVFLKAAKARTSKLQSPWGLI